jgi:hypothetical protein
MQSEKEELIKKLIITNNNEIKEKSNDLNCDFIELCNNNLATEINLEELLMLTLEAKKSLHKFNRKIESIYYSEEIAKEIKSINLNFENEIVSFSDKDSNDKDLNNKK